MEKAADAALIEQWQHVLKQTEIAQPAICLASVLWLEKLTRLGIQPDVVGGHSLGELTAFHAAGAYSTEELIRFAAFRGDAMMSCSGAAGAMASLSCSAETARSFLDQADGYAVVANRNSPVQTVISGEINAVRQVCGIAEREGVTTRLLPVANAFHSKFALEGAQILADARHLLPEFLGPLTAKLFTGMEGRKINPGLQLFVHFSDQIVSPVDFIALIEAMRNECDMMLEVGPGRVLTNLANTINADSGPVCFSVESTPGQDKDLHCFLAAYTVQGGAVNWQALHEDRLIRPFVPVERREFIVNPCERPFNVALDARQLSDNKTTLFEELFDSSTGITKVQFQEYLRKRMPFLQAVIKADMENMPEEVQPASKATPLSTEQQSQYDERIEHNDIVPIKDILLALLEKRTGFPKQNLSLDMRLLDDLNLDSIKSADLLAEAASAAGIMTHEFDSSKFANASLQEIVTALEHLLPIDEKRNMPFKAVEQRSAQEILYQLVKKRTGFPADSLSGGLRLLDDLNLDSIKSADLLAEFASSLQVAPKDAAAQYANASLAEIIRLFETERHLAPAADFGLPSSVSTTDKFPATWVRNLAIRHVEAPLEHDAVQATGGHFLIFAEAAERCYAAALEKALLAMDAKVTVLHYADGHDLSRLTLHDVSGCFAILPSHPNHDEPIEQKLTCIITRLRSAAVLPPQGSSGKRQSVSYLQFGGGYFGEQPEIASIEQCAAKAFAASLHFERPDLQVRVFDFSSEISPDLVAEKCIAELSAKDSFAAAGYDKNLIRRIPRPVIQEPIDAKERNIAWSHDDVILVTGGAKGITAECAFALAKETGVKMALAGSSAQPQGEDGAEAAATLRRFKAAGLVARYYQCDVRDKAAVSDAVAKIADELGEITGVIHGSALNRPGTVEQTTQEQAFAEIVPKVKGILNLCEVFTVKPPKIFAGFSSIIGISGMVRNAWYGFSNEAMNLILCKFGAEHPQTQISTLAYSIWDEIGMGAKLGSISHLSRKGIAPIPPQEGTARFLHLFSRDPGCQQVVVTARISGLDTLLPEEHPVPPAARFLEHVRYCYPGIEVISRVHLSHEKDSYVKDHLWRGTYLFPTVFGLEAMAQNVAFVTGEHDFSSCRIENIQLFRPIPVNPETGCEIEIRARVLERDAVNSVRKIQASIGTAQTNFTTDHFSALFVLYDQPEHMQAAFEVPKAESDLEVDPPADLYNGKILFQGPLYQRIGNLYALDATRCVFSATQADHAGPWMLGDPYLRDALLQSSQLPTVQHTSLPISIKRIDCGLSTVGIKKKLYGTAIVLNHTEKIIESDVVMSYAVAKNLVR